MIRYNISQITDSEFVLQNLYSPNINIELILNDNSCVVMSLRKAIFHGMLWAPYIKLNIPITNNEIYPICNICTDTISKVQTIQYRHLMEITDIPYMEIIKLFWDVINNSYKFAFNKLARYQKSISVYSIIQTISDPKIQAIIKSPIPSNMGTKIAETKFAQKSKELLKLLNDPTALKYNALLPFMQSEVLNNNQIPQLLMAYGTRSDLDDQMMKHVINESALSGLKTPADFAIESLSAKKTAYYLSDVISGTQYFARVLRLSNMQFRIAYSGDCGSKYLLPITIGKDHGKNFIHKVVYYNGNRIAIDENNYKELEGKSVEMLSPVGCKHIDGVCERCAGRATSKPWAYMPHVHIGSYAKSKLSARISQKVLSAKHLIKTSTVEPKLSDEAKKYFMKEANSTFIMFNQAIHRNVKNMILVVASENMNHISDLQYGQIAPEGFSLLEKVSLLDKNTEHMESIALADAQFMMHLSLEILEYMKDIASEIELIDGNYYIPLDGFKPSKPILSYVVVNDDMVAFSERIKSMISSDLRQYTSIAAAVNDLANIVYSKTNLNIFWLELIVKSLMTECIADDGKVQFSQIREGIINSSVSAKLSHEDIRRYLMQAESSVVRKGKCPLDIFFGFN
jgi:hypothetical protein